MHELLLLKHGIMLFMADYRRNNRSGGNRNFGRNRFNQGRSEMFSATCSNCGKECEVPFRPTGSKPVLCRDCFKNNRSSDSYRTGKRVPDRPQFNSNNNQNYRAQFDELNAKIDKILNLLTLKQMESMPLDSEVSKETIDEIVKEVPEKKEKAKKAKIKK
jgi:CxxC-x17-CxxC domain-containing protein